MANAIQLFKILYKTQHKPVHEVRLRSEENEVNEKGKHGVGGGGVLSKLSAAPTGYVRCF